MIEESEEEDGIKDTKESEEEVLELDQKNNKKTKTKKQVVFSKVILRNYERVHNGSLGVPSKGGFPLGLGWEYNEQVEVSIDNYGIHKKMYIFLFFFILLVLKKKKQKKTNKKARIGQYS